MRTTLSPSPSFSPSRPSRMLSTATLLGAVARTAGPAPLPDALMARTCPTGGRAASCEVRRPRALRGIRQHTQGAGESTRRSSDERDEGARLPGARRALPERERPPQRGRHRVLLARVQGLGLFPQDPRGGLLRRGARSEPHRLRRRRGRPGSRRRGCSPGGERHHRQLESRVTRGDRGRVVEQGG